MNLDIADPEFDALEFFKNFWIWHVNSAYYRPLNVNNIASFSNISVVQWLLVRRDISLIYPKPINNSLDNIADTLIWIWHKADLIYKVSGFRWSIKNVATASTT